jgi:sec-independent protein translocase protein TatA
MKTSLLLLTTSPLIWLATIAALLLLFGAKKLPELARALGRSKRALKEGLSGTDEQQKEESNEPDIKGSLTSLESIDDETLFKEVRRRSTLRGQENK